MGRLGHLESGKTNVKRWRHCFQCQMMAVYLHSNGVIIMCLSACMLGKHSHGTLLYLSSSGYFYSCQLAQITSPSLPWTNDISTFWCIIITHAVHKHTHTHTCRLHALLQREFITEAVGACLMLTQRNIRQPRQCSLLTPRARRQSALQSPTFTDTQHKLDSDLQSVLSHIIIETHG